MKHSCLGVFLAALLVVFFFISFNLVIFRFTFLNKNFWKNEFEKTQIYQKIPQSLDQYLAKDKETSADKEIREIIKKSLDANWFKKVAEKNLDNIELWLTGKTPSLVFEADMKDFKTIFEKVFNQKFQALYQSLPKCTSQQLADFQKTKTFPYCQSPKIDPQIAKNEILKEIIQIEDNYKLEKFGSSYVPKDDTERMISQFPKLFKTFLYILWGFGLMVLIILGILIILARESLKSVFRWVSLPLMISAFGFLIISLIGRIFISHLPAGFLEGFESIVFVKDILEPILSNIIADFFSFMLLWSGIIFGVGAILLIISFFLKSPQPAIVAPPMPKK